MNWKKSIGGVLVILAIFLVISVFFSAYPISIGNDSYRIGLGNLALCKPLFGASISSVYNCITGCIVISLILFVIGIFLIVRSSKQKGGK